MSIHSGNNQLSTTPVGPPKTPVSTLRATSPRLKSTVPTKLPAKSLRKTFCRLVQNLYSSTGAIISQLRQIASDVAQLKSTPAKRWELLVTSALSALASGVTVFFLSQGGV